MSANFHYIISGLPDLHFEERNPPLTLAEFDRMLHENLHEHELQGLRLLQLKIDSDNLISHITQSGKALQTGGLWQTHDEIEDWLRNSEQGPAFLSEMAEKYTAADKHQGAIELETKAAIGLAALAAGSSNRFIRDWFRFEQNLLNFLAAQDCRNFGYDINRQLADDEDFTPMLKGRREEDFGMGREYPHLLELAGNLEKENVRGKERQIDRIRWREAGVLTTNLFFTVEVLYAYRIRLSILHRWQALNESEGHRIINEFLNRILEEQTV